MITVLEISSVGLPNITKETADAFLVLYRVKFPFPVKLDISCPEPLAQREKEEISPFPHLIIAPIFSLSRKHG